MKIISKKLGLRLAALTAATVGLSGCVYEAGLGYASDGYGYNDYDCDPYSAFDSYYDCDNSYGFYNIGFGGGWYDSFWYPGHGYYVFDNYGRRFNMRDNHRRYWGDRRQRWYRDNRGHDGGRGHDNGRGYGRGNGHSSNNNGADQAIAWPERNGGRRDERPGRRADPTPPPGAVGDGNWGRRVEGQRGGRGDGRRGRDTGQGNGGQNNNAVSQPAPQPDAQPMARPGPDRRGDRAGRGDGQGRGRYQQTSNDAAQNAAPPQQQPAARQQPPARQRIDRQTARPRGEAPRVRQEPNVDEQ